MPNVIFFRTRPGVGFRYSAKQLALGFDVTGWVSNLDDGRVEMQVMGEPLEVADFLQEMHDSPLGHHILEQEEYDIPLLKNARGFSIL
ncbi:MAG: acylphosphatase [Verrucomicrobiales bacterium]